MKILKWFKKLFVKEVIVVKSDVKIEHHIIWDMEKDKFTPIAFPSLSVSQKQY